MAILEQPWPFILSLAALSLSLISIGLAIVNRRR